MGWKYAHRTTDRDHSGPFHSAGLCSASQSVFLLWQVCAKGELGGAEDGVSGETRAQIFAAGAKGIQCRPDQNVSLESGANVASQGRR